MHQGSRLARGGRLWRSESSVAPPVRLRERIAGMDTRTTSRTVKFQRPFALGDFPDLLPAGEYVVDTEEEKIDSNLVSAWHRVSSTIRVRVDGATECRPVDPLALQDALARDGGNDDRVPSPAASSSARARLDRTREFITRSIQARKRGST